MNKNQQKLKELLEARVCLEIAATLYRHISVYKFYFTLENDVMLELYVPSSFRLFKDNIPIASNRYIDIRDKQDQAENRLTKIEIKHEMIDLDESRYLALSNLISLKVEKVEFEKNYLWIYFEKNYTLNIFLQEEINFNEEDEDWLVFNI